MPTYQYACTECGHDFEQFQSFSDDTLTDCPECDGRLRKLFNAVGVVFKGSGFYRNDSRATTTSSEPGSSSSETKSETKADSTSGTKSETKKDSPKESTSGSSDKTSSSSSPKASTTSS